VLRSKAFRIGLLAGASSLVVAGIFAQQHVDWIGLRQVLGADTYSFEHDLQGRKDLLQVDKGALRSDLTVDVEARLIADGAGRIGSMEVQFGNDHDRSGAIENDEWEQAAIATIQNTPKWSVATTPRVPMKITHDAYRVIRSLDTGVQVDALSRSGVRIAP
jgi:hypothetical protein